jgi:hypothetical protein
VANNKTVPEATPACKIIIISTVKPLPNYELF